MKENKYDQEAFLAEYRKLPRSIEGLAGAGEWPAFRALMPPLRDRHVLDLGCGFGWHCRYAADQGAASVTGIDISGKMLAEARKRTASPVVIYRQAAIEDFYQPEETMDVVISSLALHYISDYHQVCRRVYDCLRPHGWFVFSVEHPVYTADGRQDWIHDAEGRALYWPVDRYFTEGLRDTVFLSHAVKKYHRTLSTYVETLCDTGFHIKHLLEPVPSPEMLASCPGFQDELRRPMMLLLSGVKPA